MQDDESRPGGSRALWLLPLVATLAIQTTMSFLARLVPTCAPLFTAATGLAPESVGVFSGLGTLGSIVVLAIGTPLIRRFGPIRSLQAGLVLAGLGLVLLTPPSWLAILAANILIGIGYGPSAPAGSEVLLRHAPPAHRTLIFSLKQAGVPLGGVAAGLALPWLVARMDWRDAVLLLAAVPLLTVLLVQPIRASVDAGRVPDQPVGLRVLLAPSNMMAPLRFALSSPVLRRLMAAGAFFAIGQGSLFAFTVTWLVDSLGYDLATAGFVFAVTQGTGIFGRIALGWISDRWGSGLRTLRWNALAMAATMTGFAFVDAATPLLAVCLLGGLAGITVSSWNGVHLAEIARHAPAGRIGEATAGASLVTFLGYVAGPIGFAVLSAATGRYDSAFLAVAVAGLAAFAALAAGRGRPA